MAQSNLFDFAALTLKGMEEVCSQEICRLIRIEGKPIVLDRIITFKADLSNACHLCYCSQSVLRVFLLVSKVSAEDVEDYAGKIRKCLQGFTEQGFGLGGFLKKGNVSVFSSECIRVDNDNLTSIEVEQETTKVVANELKRLGISAKPVFKRPDLLFFTFVNGNDFFFGIDLAGFDLGKRSYKIFPNKNSLKGPLGFAVGRIVDYSADDFFLVVYCGDGVVAIEAALDVSHFPVRYYQKEDFAFVKFPFLAKQIRAKSDLENGILPQLNDANLNDANAIFESVDSRIDLDVKTKIRAVDGFMGNVVAAKKNAKIAGIIKKLDISRIGVDWLDVKMREKQVDKIVGLLPQPSKNVSDAVIAKHYKEFFYQAKYILKDEGSILILIKNDAAHQILMAAAEEFKFKISEEHELWQGAQRMLAVVLIKKS